MEDKEILREFLIESNENLTRLDQEFVELEKRPKDSALLASIFRTIHTIKGTCGFLGLPRLGKITHVLENILSELRNGQRDLTPEVASISLEAVDAIRALLTAVETTGGEGTVDFEDLCRRLAEVAEMKRGAGAANGAEAAEESAASVNRGGSIAESTIRVDVVLLDKLMNLVGELVLARNQILQVSAARDQAALNATSQRLNLITSELQEGVMRTRMQPIGVVWNKFPRLVRDLAHQCGKEIRLAMHGSGTELDKTIIEAIKDPLTHILRNCCDHGLESAEVRLQRGKPVAGTITMRAFHEGGHVNIEIGDDGGGMDLQRIRAVALQRGVIGPEQAQRLSERETANLVFMPGFSTAKAVTEISGRGVGLDVVKTNIEKIGGTVELSTRPQQGTTIRLKIPLTLAIIPGLVIASGGERFVIPQVSLLELVRREGDPARFIERVHGTPVYRRRGSLLPLIFLNELLGLESRASEADVTNVVILQAESRQFGLVVDSISDTQEIVVKPLGKQLKRLTCYAGATIMGDGRVALILDVMGIAQRCGIASDAHRSEKQETVVSEDIGHERQLLLLFRGGDSQRIALPLALVARLEEIPRARIERAGGQLVVQYRGRILPLSFLDESSSANMTTASDDRGPAQVVVVNNGERSLGIVVDQILDIVAEDIRVRMPARRAGLLGSVVVGGKVTDLLDLQAVVSAADPDWFEQTKTSMNAPAVLLADASSFSRALVRAELEMAGYRVFEAATADEAVHHLRDGNFHAVVAATDLPAAAGADLLATIRDKKAGAKLPLLGLTANGPDIDRLRSVYDDCAHRFDRQGMLESLQRLLCAVQPETQEHPPVMESQHD